MTNPKHALSRRRLLAAVGAGVLAGCVDLAGSRRHAVGDRVGDRRVTLESATVRRAVATLDAGSPAHVDVAAAGGEQFVVATVRAGSGSPPPASAFDVAVDGERVGTATYRLEPFDGDANPRRVAVRVPATEGERASLVWDRGPGDAVRWALPAPAVRALGRLPAFDVRRFSVPDAVREGEPIDVTLAVANTGDRDGRFLAELGAVVLSDVGEVRFDVPTGETVTREVALTPSSYTSMYGDETDPLPVVLDWGTDRMEREVAVERG